MSLEMCDKNEQPWRRKLHRQVKRGQRVVYADGEKLTAEQILTTDAAYMDMAILTKDELKKANGDPQKALLTILRDTYTSSGGDGVDRCIGFGLMRAFEIPRYKQALGSIWRD